MAELVRQECLACTHHPSPVCDGSGVRLVRDAGRVVDVQLCVRWPASWDEPIAYWEALARYDIDAIPVTTVPDRIWPAVQAEVIRTRQATAGQETPTYAETGPARAVGSLLVAVIAVLVVAAVGLVVLW